MATNGAWGFWHNKFEAKEADLDNSDYNSEVRRGAAQQGQARFGQEELARMFLDRAQGQGPSLAQMQAQQLAAQAQAQQAGAIASARGLNPAQQQRLMLQQGAAMQQAAAGQGAMLGMQERQEAAQMAQQGFGQMRGQDQAMFGQAGGLQNQQNANRIQNRAQANQINAQVTAQNAATDQAMAGKLFDVAAKGASMGAMAHGGPVPFPMAAGGPTPPWEAPPPMVPGHDSPAYDVVPAQLSPEEVVLPRSVTQSEHAPERAAGFMAAIQSQKKQGIPGMAHGGVVTYPELLARRRELDEQIVRHEARAKTLEEQAQRLAMGGRVRGYAGGGSVFPELVGDDAPPRRTVKVDPVFIPAPATSSGLGSGLALTGEDAGAAAPPLEPAPASQAGLTWPKLEDSDNVASLKPSPVVPPKADDLPGAVPLVAPKKESAPVVKPGVPAPGAKPGVVKPGGVGGGAQVAPVKEGPSEGEKLTQQGIDAEAAAASQKAADEVAAMDTYEAKKAQIAAEHAKQREELTKKGEAIKEEIEKGKVDPFKFWHSRTAGQKAAAIIGMVLGGIGAGLQGKDAKNVGIESFDKMVAEDIDAQKHNLETKKGLLATHMQEVKDLQAAQELAKADLKDGLQGQIARAAAKNQDPKAKAEALKMGGALKMQVDQHRAQAADRLAHLKLEQAKLGLEQQRVNIEAGKLGAMQAKAEKGKLAGGLMEKLVQGNAELSTAELAELIKDKDLHGRLVQVAPGRWGLVGDPAARKEVADALAGTSALNEQFSNLLAMAGTRFLPSEAKARAEAAATLLRQQFGKQLMGSMTRDELENATKIIGDPNQWNTADFKARIQEAQRASQAGLRGVLNANVMGPGQSPLTVRKAGQ